MSGVITRESKGGLAKGAQAKGAPGIARDLAARIQGDVLFDAPSRGRYATDASIYQMMPLGVVVPRDLDDVRRTIEAAGRHGAPLLPRGGGTSQCGQTVNEAIVIDNTKHLNRIIELDVVNRRCVVEPGIVLDELNRALKPHGLWFPVDVSTASRATIGGMTANNSCGSRSIRYGLMRDNVLAIDAILADGTEMRFDDIVPPAGLANDPGERDLLFRDLLALGQANEALIADRFPKVMRRVGGYNIDALVPQDPAKVEQKNHMAHLLIGSEGTLAYSSAIELKLSPLPRNKVLGVCHFPSFYAAMDAAQHLVTLDPTAVELIDDTMIALARDIDIYRPTIEQFVRGDPEALLLVEFAEADQKENLRRLKALGDMMGDLGFAWNNDTAKRGGVIEAVAPSFQSAIFEVRKAGLNIMMSMKDERKPISFVEDCAVALKDLADYTANLTAIFQKHGTKGTWYAHASVGCLHVRPVLNLRLDQDVKAMRAIAEEAFEMVRDYKGSHSGEHGDGIVRSEFHEQMFGQEMVGLFREVKQRIDPHGRFNPGKIVDPPKMDDRRLFRFGPDYRVAPFKTELDWSAWPGEGGGFQGAVEMCNNNGACRKLSGGAMCPSYRVTRNEKDLTRGRANTLRLALSGQLGPDALTADETWEALELCVGCKACKRECPTGVDMAKMKIEIAAARVKAKGLSLHDRLVAWLPRYAPVAAALPWAFNLRNHLPGLAALLEGPTGFSRARQLPAWRGRPPRFPESEGPSNAKTVILFGDTFSSYFEPENLTAARRVLLAGGYRVLSPRPCDGSRRPLCCGRTFLTAGVVDQAHVEARRLLAAYLPLIREGAVIVGLEPSCLLTLRDELTVLLPGEDSRMIADSAFLLEEFLAREKPKLLLKPLARKALLHGHCHQKAFNAMGTVKDTLAMIPHLDLEIPETSCCGMAGAFGYATKTRGVSLQMAEQDLLPAVRQCDEETLLIADGTSCRHQIFDGSGRQALHVARILEMALAETDPVG